VREETLKLGSGIYTPADAAKILRLQKSKVSYWFRSYIKNKIESSTGFRYYHDLDNNQIAVNFYSLIEFYVFHELKNRGVKTRRIIEAHKSISQALNTPYPFASAKLLTTTSREVLFEENVNSVVKASYDLQYLIFNFIRPFCEKIEFGEDSLPTKFYPLGKDKKIVVDPEHQFGSPIIKGTNILVSTISELYSAGETVPFIAKLYDISAEQVQDAISYSSAA